MNWLIFVLIAAILDAIRIFIDNYLSDVFFKDRLAVSQKMFSAYMELIVAVIFLAFNGFNLNQTELPVLLLFMLSGIIATLGAIPYYKALEIEESTNLGILIQLAPIFYLILGCIFLGETVSIKQIVAIFIILLAPILIVATSHKKSRKVKTRAIIYSLFYVLLAVIGNLIFVNTNNLPTNHLNFIDQIAFYYIGMAFINFILVYSQPKWKNRFRSVAKKNGIKLIGPMILNHMINVGKSIVYRIGLITAPIVALASAASDSVLPIIIFFMGIVLTLIWPKFGREKLTKKTVLVHLVATIIVVCGIILMQF